MRLVKLVLLASVAAAAVSASASAFTFIGDPLPVAIQGTAYKVELAINGGAPPIHCKLLAGSLPAGMKVGDENDKCYLSGTPTEYGTYTFDAEATCEGCGNPPTQGSFTLKVLQKLTIATNALMSATVNTPYSATLTTTGAGSTPLAWSIDSGILPPGLTMTSAGVISGTPTTAGSWAFKVRVRDNDGGPRFDTRTLTLNVVTPLAASVSGAVPKAEVGRPFKAAVGATGGLAPYKFAIAGGSAPVGVNVDASTGVVSGVPTAAGSFTFEVGVTDADGRTASTTISVTVAAAVKVAATRLRTAHEGVRYSARLKATGGVAPRKWRVLGKIPPGLRLNPATGVLSGSPRKIGVFRFSVRVTDALGARSTRKLTLTVAA